jgi:oligosaccharide repeat unit polymerase
MNVTDYFWLPVFVSLIFLAINLSQRIYGHWFTPLSIYVGINSLSFAGYHLRLLEMPDTSATLHALVLSSFAMFFLGVLLAVGTWPVGKELPAKPVLDTTNLSGFFYTTVVLSTLGWVTQGALLVMKMGPVNLLRNIWVLQGEFQVQFVGYLNMIGILVFPLFVLRWAAGKVKKVDYLLVFLSLFGLLLAGIKGYMIYSVFGGVYVWSVVRPDKFRLVHLAGGIAAILAFFIVYAAKVDIFSTDFYVGTGLMKMFPALHMPYLYFVGSWPALDFILDGTVADLPRLGTFVLQPVWKILGAVGFIDFTPLYQPFVSLGKFTFNVYSLIGEVYWDLKWPGVLGVSLLLGLVSTRLYMRIWRCSYWGHVMVYMVVVHGLFISFFSFIYTFNVYVLLLYIFVVGFVIPRGGILVKGPQGSSSQPGQEN